MDALCSYHTFRGWAAKATVILTVLGATWWSALAQTTPTSLFDYSSVTGSGSTIHAVSVPVITAAGTTIYKNVSLQFNVDSAGNLTLASNYPQVVAADQPQATSFIPGNYAGPSTLYSGKALFGVNGSGSSWSLAASSGANGCTYPNSANWFTGSITSNPYATRIQNAGITSTAWSYGVGSGASCSPGQAWNSNTLLGFSQVGNSITVVSFTNNGKDRGTPVDQVTYTLTGVSISGYVTSNETGLAGVKVALSGSTTGTATTDGYGYYSFVNLPTAGNYTVTPSMGGLIFSPPNASFTNLQSSQASGFAAVLSPPFGSLDIPTNNTANVAGALNVGGWALSSLGVANIGIWRDPINGEPTAANGYVFLANAAQIAGARPDIGALYPGYPDANYGWGMQILTNELPGTGGKSLGNGTYRIHAIATDTGGTPAEIGASTFSTTNTGSLLPFGTLDTPANGTTVSGSQYVVFGWALTPEPAAIPIDGSTLVVYVDNQPVGHPTYNNYRPDIATLFPGYANSNAAIFYLTLNTTTLSNGLHNIAVSATDNQGHVQGIGSRYFIVQN